MPCEGLAEAVDDALAGMKDALAVRDEAAMAEVLREFGARSAGWADDAEAKLRAEGVEPLPRCASCAFRAGTFPNTRAPATALDAVKCLIEHHPFGCHHDKVDGLPTRPCAGFVNILAAEVPDAVPGKAPWRFSDDPMLGGDADRPQDLAAGEARR